MGTFPTLVKRYRKTVQPPDKRPLCSLRKGGSGNTYFWNRMYLFTLWKRRYDMCTVVLCCHSHFFVCTEKRTKRSHHALTRDPKQWKIIKPSAPKSYPGPRGPLLKYRGWNKPCSRFDKAPETRTIGNEIRKTTTSGTQGTKKLLRSLKRGRRMQEVLITGLWLGKFWWFS